MAAILEKIAKLAIPAGLAIGGIQTAMYDGKWRKVMSVQVFDVLSGGFFFI